VPFYPESRPVPERLIADWFHLRPLTPAAAGLDYAALMESRKRLRVASLSSWPADDFTLDANVRDLKRHHQDHVARKAFTYTVLDPAETECLGCLYIHPLLDHVELFADRATVAAIVEDEAAAYFWVRTSREGTPFERELLSTLISWFQDEWRFSRVLFFTHTEDRHQEALFRAAGLSPVLTFDGLRESVRAEYFGPTSQSAGADSTKPSEAASAQN